jgi:hypothetical protein
MRPATGATPMTLIKLLTAPIRRLVNFSLFQFCIVILIIFLLQVAPDSSLGGEAFNGLDKLVSASIANAIEVKSFTRSLLTFGLMIVYVYVVYLLALAIAHRLIRRCVDFAGRHNFLGLRNAIARERGIAAYRAWEPLEHIRPRGVPQPVWEERFAWPTNDEPPYPSLWRRALFELASFVLVVLLVFVLLQVFTPIPALSWAAARAEAALGWLGCCR